MNLLSLQQHILLYIVFFQVDSEDQNSKLLANVWFVGLIVLLKKKTIM
jgi:hypothetical protein